MIATGGLRKTPPLPQFVLLPGDKRSRSVNAGVLCRLNFDLSLDWEVSAEILEPVTFLLENVINRTL